MSESFDRLRVILQTISSGAVPYGQLAELMREAHTLITTAESEEARLNEGRVEAIDKIIELSATITSLEDKVEGLDSDLFEAVQVAYRRGATDWAKLNYKGWMDQLYANKKADDLRNGIVAPEDQVRPPPPPPPRRA